MLRATAGDKFEVSFVVSFNLLLFFTGFLVFDLRQLVEVFGLTGGRARLHLEDAFVRLSVDFGFLSLRFCPP